MILQHSGPAPDNMPAIRTLVIDDSSLDRKRILRMGDRVDLPMVFEEVSSLGGLQSCLDRQTYDLFLVDYMMPEGDGLTALEMIHKHQAHHDASAIMISGASDSRAAVAALKHGCTDFLLKDDMSPQMLRRAVVDAMNASRHLARHFDRPQPVIDVDSLRQLLQLALDDKFVRDILRAPLEEGIQAAMRKLGADRGLLSAPDFQRFLVEFDRPDDFEFR